MHTVRSVDALRASLRPIRDRGDIGLVPTMGALHDGHLSLIRRARAECAIVVVSVFVNPAQFDDPGDLAAYPRDEAADAALADAAGADVLFTPTVEVVYPPGFATSVEVGGALTSTLEGASRGAGHFGGVTTVVTKLLAMVGPDIAYFGQKDAQQLAVVRRLVCDLDLPARVTGCPTVREPDGLALSSRNVHLHAVDRCRAAALHQGLAAAERCYGSGERAARVVGAAALGAMACRGVEAEYLELVHPDTFMPVASVLEPTLVAVAARVGAVRLIDNTLLEPAAALP